jgi:transaldolase
MYVVDLVADGIVNTMPEATIHAVADHGTVTGDTIRSNYSDAHGVLEALKAVGIDYDDVVRVLEEEGVEKFMASWQELTDSTKSELERMAAAK